MFSFCSHDKNNENIRAGGPSWHAGAIALPEVQQGRELHCGQPSDMFGHGREIRSVKFKCKDCNST